MSWLFRRCQHAWEKVSETTLPSPYEQIVAATGSTTHARVHTQLPSFTGNKANYQKRHVLVAQCTECGEIRKFETVNP